ncbi:MAG TPA: endonuclease III [Bacteroidota bacterium]|nr:endonuclease III [Bacteroidota bacterium]
MTTVDWVKAFEPLIKQYKGRKHPLNYQNRYQLLVMVLLSAQDSDRNINMLAPALFERYPSMKALATAKPEDLYRYIKHVRNFATKARWLTQIATTLEDDKNIPATLEELTKLPGIGRKSANVIIRESGGPAEGIIVDLHVRRVAPRIGIATSDKPEKIEKQMMEVLPKRYWNDAGMACSFLGREICRPTNPKCGDCVMIDVCQYYKTVIKKKKA